MKLKHSLAYQLLKVTFSFYLLITVTITVMHMYTVWIQAETYLEADLKKLGDSAQRGITLALWDLDYVSVDLIVEGLLELPIVIGVEIKDRKIDKLYGKLGNIDKHYQMIHEEGPGVTYDIGDMTMYSSSGIVFDRVKNGYLLTVINAIIKTFALWIIVLLAGKKLITKPLVLLTEANKSVDLENVETFKEVNIGIAKSDNELVFLEESFNKMVQRLAIDRQELARINQNLEFIVEQRTRELQKTNETLKQEITVRKHTEEKLTISKEQAEAANQAKSEFLANMSHELRTPLNAVLGFSQLMQQDQETPPSQREDLEIINRSGHRLLALISDVLDMSKIEAGRIVLNAETFDMDELVRDVIEIIRSRAEDRGLQLILDQSSDFPRYVETDPSMLRRILINLLSNAVKYTEEGGVTLRLGAHNGHPEHAVLRIEVEDTGIGIDKHDLEHIFQPFEQLGVHAQREGTGLGLALTTRFVEMMGGEIGVESTVGKGSLFCAEIPVSRIDEDKIAQVELSRGRVVGLETGQPKYRILIVED
jgi:signal transduction histidine kinase